MNLDRTIPTPNPLSPSAGRSRRAAAYPRSFAGRTVTLLDLPRGLELTRVVWRPAARPGRRAR